jgi:hypothetical protein
MLVMKLRVKRVRKLGRLEGLFSESSSAGKLEGVEQLDIKEM